MMNTLLIVMTPQLLICWLPAFNPLVAMLTIDAYRRALAQALLCAFSNWSWSWRQQQQEATTNQIQVAPANQLRNNGGVRSATISRQVQNCMCKRRFCRQLML
jgi:hypothetical protein